MARLAMCFLLLFPLVGCGGGEKFDLNKVTGTVTLDGKPLSGAIVTFYPAKTGPSAGAITDSSGKFDLHDRAGKSGAVAGEHSVSITTAPGADGVAVKETIPPRYNTATELKETVKAGENKFDFTLTSKKEGRRRKRLTGRSMRRTHA